jgi:CHAT domain-containing protein
MACGHEVARAATSSDSLLAAAESLYTSEEYDSARAVWTLALRATQAAGDEPGRARALTWLGLVAVRLGDRPEAQRLGEEALVLKTRLGMTGELSLSYHSLGLAALDADRNEEAKRLFQQALDAAEKVRDVRGAAKAEGGLGLAFGYLGDLVRAREGHRNERELARTIGDLRLEANGVANEAMVDIWEGNALPAIARLDTARALYRRNGYAAGEENALGQLATAYELTGREDLALAALDSSLIISRRLGLKEQEADLLRLIGGVQLRLGDYRAALASYDDAEAQMRGAGLEANLGAVLRGSADANFRLGNLPRADQRLREALRRHTESGEPLDRLDDLLLASEVEYRLAGPAAAETRLREGRAVADLVNTRGARIAVVLTEAHLADLGKDSHRVLRVLHAALPDLAGDLGAEWISDALAARAHGRLGALDSAYADGRRAVAAVDKLRGGLASEALRSTYIADRAEVYGDLVVTLLRLGRAGEAFQVADAARSRGLLDHLGSARGAATSGAVPPEIAGGERLLQRIDELVQRLRATERSRPRERGVSGNPAGAPVAAELAQARSEYEALMVRAAQRNARSTAILGASPVQLEDVRASLQPDEALIEYLLIPGRLLAFVVRSDSLRVVSADLAEGTLVQRVRLLGALWGRNGAEWELGLAASRALHQLLVQPIMATGALRGVRHLAIVPHGILGQLPFAALQDAASGHFLSQDFSVINFPAAAALPALRARRTLASEWNAGGVGFAPFAGNHQLPATGPEVEAFRSSAPRRVARMGSAATEAALRASLAGKGVVHVATHGVLNVRSPLFSRIELSAQRGGASDNDGRLEVHELLGLSIRSALVFLSGCETGAGPEWLDDPVRGTGDLTLAQAVLSAGAANVITTLWRIEDSGAAKFAEIFYRSLRQLPLAEAFAAAQRAMAADSKYHSPYYWAGYVLAGEGGLGQAPQAEGFASVSLLTGTRPVAVASNRSKP